MPIGFASCNTSSGFKMCAAGGFSMNCSGGSSNGSSYACVACYNGSSAGWNSSFTTLSGITLCPSITTFGFIDADVAWSGYVVSSGYGYANYSGCASTTHAQCKFGLGGYGGAPPDFTVTRGIYTLGVYVTFDLGYANFILDTARVTVSIFAFGSSIFSAEIFQHAESIPPGTFSASYPNDLTSCSTGTTYGPAAGYGGSLTAS